MAARLFLGPDWRRRSAAAWLTAGLAAASCWGASQASASPLCAADPINPLCCPSPCPVADLAKIADFADQAANAWQDVAQCRQLADRYAGLFSALGAGGLLSGSPRRTPGAVSAALTTFTPALEPFLAAGDPGDPRAMAETVKLAMFDPAGQTASVTDAGRRRDRRDTTGTEEAFNGMAAGLHGGRRLTDLAADGGQQALSAGQAADWRADWAANAAARQAVLDNLGGLEELLATWAAGASSAAGTVTPTSLGPLAASAASAAPAVSAAGDGGGTGAALHQADSAISSLTALHNERHAVNVMRAQYPALRTTVASDEAAIQFRATDAASASALLGQVFSDGGAAFDLAKAQLLSLDTTRWIDNAAKVGAAAAAAEAVVQSIRTNPQAYGTLAAAPGPDGTPALPENLAATFSAWLEDDKLERFWQPLRQDAEAAIQSLDQRLGQITQRQGFDVGSAAAVGEEQTLLARFDQAVSGLAGTDSLDDGRKAAVEAFAAAARQAADAVRADGSAGRFVSVAWPR